MAAFLRLLPTPSEPLHRIAAAQRRLDGGADADAAGGVVMAVTAQAAAEVPHGEESEESDPVHEVLDLLRERRHVPGR